MNQIMYFDSAGHLPKAVLVVPETIRSEALLVNKEIRPVDMGYLGCPVDSHSQKRSHGIGDDLSGISTVLGRRCDAEVHVRRCYFNQIAGIGKKIPGLFQIDRQDLSALKGKWFHDGLSFRFFNHSIRSIMFFS